MVEVLGQQVDRVVGDYVGHLQQTDVQGRHHELHQVISEGHLLYLLLALVFHQLNDFLCQLLPLGLQFLLGLNFLLCLPILSVQTQLVLALSELPVLLEQLVIGH